MSVPILPFRRAQRHERPAPPVLDAPVIREDAPPPGTEIHTGQSTEGAFIVRVVTVAGETDGELLAALIAYTERIDRKRHEAPAAQEAPRRARRTKPRGAPKGLALVP